MIALLLGLAAIADAPQTLRFDCQLRLNTGQRFTAPSPVGVSFTQTGKALSAIRVVDAGGILYPGGNMVMSTNAEGSTVLGGQAMPAERPGSWSGRVGKSYDLTLADGAMKSAASIKLATKPDRDGYVMEWQAQGGLAGAPGPTPTIKGSGIGLCTMSKGVSNT